jgi:hypothetical protein
MTPRDDDFLARVEPFAEPRAGRSMAHRGTPRACGAQRRSALLEVAAAQIAGSGARETGIDSSFCGGASSELAI